jgi:hypothetical protein
MSALRNEESYHHLKGPHWAWTSLTMPQHRDPHFGGLVPCGGEGRAAVLCAFLNGVPQPAEQVDSAIRQHMGLHGHTHLQSTPMFLPGEADVCRT